MTETLYNRMNWPEIEGIVYSECDHPADLLGAHVTEDGILIQMFSPHAKEVAVKLTATGKEYPMELADEAGFFAVLIPRKTVPAYTYLVTYDNDTTEEVTDPYNFASQITEKDAKRFAAGIHYEIYEKLGAHPMTIGGVAGTHFAVWAPNAWRVSVVGTFNLWDGRIHQMQRVGDTGIFELFLPGVEAGALYKYEIKWKGGLTVLKADPYASAAELRPNNASVVTDLSDYTWSDANWQEAKKKKETKQEPMAIYEVHLGSWKKPEEGEFYNYRELAPMLCDYVKEMGYTHIELMPVMEHPFDASWGYQVTGYYAPTSRYGTPQDFMYFMDYMHQNGIGVILDWVPAHFPRDTFGLAEFDGTCLYEHKDPRQGSHPHWGTLIFNYGRPQVSNFLIANALFWSTVYHADGIRMDAVASMLYLDYGKNDGEWVANMYGGNENLEALEMLKHLNSIFKKKNTGTILIAEESTAWPRITGDVDDGAVGFDYKWNMGWMNDFTGYMQCDPYFRKHHYGELTFSMIYAYSEKFILVLSHDEVVHGKGSMLGKMPGETMEEKAANLRAAYSFMMGHPGKKLLFMGQDFAQMDEWNEAAGLQWPLLQFPVHANMQACVKALNELYRTQPALSVLDDAPEGFEWVNSTSWENSTCSFLRKTENPEETLLFVCNFEPVAYDKFNVGVPFAGKYKEIFNCDSEAFGGSGMTNPRVKTSKKEECDERENSITIKLAPLGVSVFRFTGAPVAKKAAEKKATEKKVTEKKVTEKKAAEKKAAVKKTAEKKPAAKTKKAGK